MLAFFSNELRYFNTLLSFYVCTFVLMLLHLKRDVNSPSLEALS
jgi:hypothetical protein